MNISPRHTSIIEALETAYGTLVREDYFKYPVLESNIYMLDHEGKPLWFAELPMPKDCYANRISNLNEENFSCASWEGFTCRIDLRTGKIIERHFTK